MSGGVVRPRSAALRVVSLSPAALSGGPLSPAARRVVPLSPAALSGGRRFPPPGTGTGIARMLAARKRLLGLLVLLAIASGALAERRLAAWWVVLPPIVMLLGYLGLLREAAKADAERLAAGRSRAARDPVTAGRSDATSAGGALAGGPEAAERRAEVIEISATREQVEEEQLYDQVADAKRRAVGD